MAQEILAHLQGQRPATEMAVPGQRQGAFHRRRRMGWQYSSRGRGWGTVMRHFLFPSTVTTLALGVGAAAT